ncbi:hypothetical protein FHW79_006049 [Azospirillum sp. OGB3]|uniref:hypothetical protein n=1 Tax=Azospirillum sp. OGB3 TaxID=2587012 RepID=UPI001606A22C|nr:hypothetical protein [Azospirillum sp. OGB3]MBB3268374.1 hypothetical protein [Azospirillum sp. OGB3]
MPLPSHRPLHQPSRRRSSAPPGFGALGWGLLRAVEDTARRVGALDQALHGHPLAPAWTLHQRLAAVVRESRVDGHLVDPHRLAALGAGLRPVAFAAGLRPAERAAQVLALAHALDLHAWHAAPLDGGKDSAGGAVREALGALSREGGVPAVIAAGSGLWRWLEAGGARGPARAAIPHLLASRGLTRRPLAGLTGAAALGVLHAERRGSAWLAAFVEALGREADDGLELLHRLERAWRSAREALADRADQPGRRAVRTGAGIARALDLIAAQPLTGPARLAGLLGLSLHQTGVICQELTSLGAVAELTGRRSRRLYGLTTLAPVRLHTAGPRPVGRHRQALDDVLAHDGSDDGSAPRPPLPPPTHLPELEVAISAAEWAALMTETDQAIARSQALLKAMRTT